MTMDFSKIRIFIRPGHTDLRKAVNGLAVMIEELMAGNRSAGTYTFFATGDGNC